MLSAARVRASPEVRVGIDVRSLRVPHDLRGRFSKKSENSMGDWLGRVGGTSSLGVCEGCLGFVGFLL